MTDNKYDNSAILDVHTSSEHPEVNKFVDEIHGKYFADWLTMIQKKHFKVVLLDLYLRWREDPTMYTAVHMSPNDYKGDSRYNKLSISTKTIRVVQRLKLEELISFKKGWSDETTGKGFLSRIRPTDKLIKSFRKAAFPDYFIGHVEGRETVIMRIIEIVNDKEKKVDIDYTDTINTRKMRDGLSKYNSLLRKTFIDIPTVDTPPKIDARKKKNKPKWVTITPRAKFVRRIFNNGSWKQGGRYYGGWWQRISSEWRRKIYMDGKPTVEDDYSSLHIALLYAWEDVDFYTEYKSDPYVVTVDGIDDPAESRALVKLLFLMSINAESEKKAFSALRQSFEGGNRFKKYNDKQYGEILKRLKENHPAIAHNICTGAGIDLMYVDSKISEIVINEFTKKGLPILCIHDSYVVQWDQTDLLKELMERAMRKVTKKIKWPRVDRKGLPERAIKNRINYLIKQEKLNVTIKELLKDYAIKGETSGYQKRMKNHNDFKQYIEGRKGAMKIVGRTLQKIK